MMRSDAAQDAIDLCGRAEGDHPHGATWQVDPHYVSRGTQRSTATRSDYTDHLEPDRDIRTRMLL